MNTRWASVGVVGGHQLDQTEPSTGKETCVNGSNRKTSFVPTFEAWERQEMIRTGLLLALEGNTSFLDP